jgi:hypothetical protein
VFQLVEGGVPGFHDDGGEGSSARRCSWKASVPPESVARGFPGSCARPRRARCRRARRRRSHPRERSPAPSPLLAGGSGRDSAPSCRPRS